MHFESDTFEDLVSFFRSENFNEIEMSRTLAESLMKGLKDHDYYDEIKIVESRTVRSFIQ